MRHSRNLPPNAEEPRPAAVRMLRHASAMVGLTASALESTEPVAAAVADGALTAVLEAVELFFAMSFPAPPGAPAVSPQQRVLLQLLAVGSSEDALARAKPDVNVFGELDAACRVLGAATRTAAVATALRNQLIH